VNYRLHGFFKGLLRLLCLGLGAGALYLGWLAFLRFGPGLQGGPPIYLFHAKALVRSRLAFPKPAPTILVPAPQTLSSADVQLRLMKWWDGRNWLPEARAHGESAKGGLRLHGGKLNLVEVVGVAPPPAKGGEPACRLRVKVRWDFPEDLQELLRVQEIVGLRFPKGPAPGQSAEMACTFVRKGWRWELVSLESTWGEQVATGPARRSLLDWLF
jgi:hypothetical protein